MIDSTAARYDALVAAGELERDSAQEMVVAKLGRLNERLAVHRLARKSSSLGWLFGKRDNGRAANSRASISGAMSGAARPC